MRNDFVWLYCTLFRRHRNVMEFVCLYAAVAFSPFWDEGKVAATCVFPRNALLSSPPSIIPSLHIITGARPVIHVHHGRMRTLVRAATVRLRCLHACIFRLKSAYAIYVNTIMLAAIMSLIALFKSKYCVYTR